MRFLSILSLILIFTSCNSKTKPNKPDFLIGNWIRLNNQPNILTFEKWNSNLKGIGYTLKKQDTTFKEILAIEEINDTLYLKVTGVNESPTLFKFIKQTDTSFTCTNEKNEFPKKIKYWKQKEKLYAKVSNDEFKLDFIFKGMEKSTN